MTIVKQRKRFIKAQQGDYTIEIQDYQYRSRPPVAVRVSGTRLGECVNPFGEPCYFYQSDEVMSLSDGMERAKQIIRNAAPPRTQEPQP